MSTVKYASFGIRLVAHILDQLILAIVLSPIFALIFGAKEKISTEELTIMLNEGKLPFTTAEILLQIVVPAIIIILFWLKKGATPGKILLKLKIIDATTGGNLSSSQCISRYFAYIISFIPMFLGFFWMLWDEKKQTWHDKFANTVVVINEESLTPKENTTSRTDNNTFTA